MDGQYTFFFTPETATPLTCGLLSRKVLKAWPRPRDAPAGAPGRRVVPLRDLGPLGAPGPAGALPRRSPPESPRAEGPADPADLDDASLWVAVLRFQWALACDRAIDARALDVLIRDLAGDGALEGARAAFRRLTAALAAAYPLAATLAPRALAQVVALGRDLALAAAASPDLLGFVEKELQAVDLAAALQL